MKIEDLPIGQIKPHASNVRRALPDGSELANSIREQGILQPLVVAPDFTDGDLDHELPPDQTPMVVIAGHRRLAAAKDAGLTVVPCIVRADLRTAGQQVEAMLVENLQRADLSAVEEADAYEQLLAFPGYTVAKVAKKTGRSKATVQARLKLTKLGAEAREKVHTGQASLADAETLTEFAGTPKILAHLTGLLGSPNFRYELERARRQREIAVKIIASRKAAAGATVLVQYPHGKDLVTLDWIVSEETGEPVDVDPTTDLASFVAYISPHNGILTWFFDGDLAERGWAEIWDWRQRHPAAGTAATVATSAPQASVDPEQERVLAELDVAARVRRAHLTSLLSASVPPPDTWSRIGYAILEAEDFGHHGSLQVACQLLGLPADIESPTWQAAAVHSAALRKEIERRTWAVLLAIAIAADEWILDDIPPEEVRDDHVLQAYLQWVAATGYTFSPVEAEQILAPPDTPIEGPVCQVCGCTDGQACDGGCGWAETDDGSPLCTACAQNGAV